VQTSILGRILITRFDSTGLYPKESAVRSYRLNKLRSYSVAGLDTYCAHRGLEGGFAQNATRLLDAIIDDS
jgi:hypothetical protein